MPSLGVQLSCRNVGMSFSISEENQLNELCERIFFLMKFFWCRNSCFYLFLFRNNSQSLKYDLVRADDDAVIIRVKIVSVCGRPRKDDEKKPFFWFWICPHYRYLIVPHWHEFSPHSEPHSTTVSISPHFLAFPICMSLSTTCPTQQQISMTTPANNCVVSLRIHLTNNRPLSTQL